MRITDSNIMMTAGRRYAERGGNYSREEKSTSATSDIFSQIANGGSQAAGNVKNDVESNLQNELISLRDSLLQELLRRMLSSGLFGGTNGTFGGFGRQTGFQGTGGFGGSVSPAGFGGLSVSAGRGGLSFTQTTYAEEETTAFLAQGMARTEDGRQIDFDVNILMSRSFVQYTQINVPLFSDALFDPLMINTGSAIARLSDQTFKFDLDMDGTEDNIAMPESGTGFLALDLNEDGIINDGSELFGVKSGNGFADLAAYDSDGNGWIDENDEVYSKLKVWYKNGDGKDELVDLQAADVGAIYLGNEKTDFSMYGSAFQLSGAVRATGLFLRESGGVGTVQHVDLAKQREAVLAGTENTEQTVHLSAEGLSGGAGGAILINTGQSGNTQSETETDEQIDSGKTRAEKQKERAKARSEEESARRDAAKKRRMEKEELNKEAAERLQRRKELRREELEALFEDRKERQEQFDAMLQERRKEHAALNSGLLNTEAVDSLAANEIEAVA